MTLTAERPLRRGEHEVTFRDGLHLLVMVARYLVRRYLEDFVAVGNIPQCEELIRRVQRWKALLALSRVASNEQGKMSAREKWLAIQIRYFWHLWLHDV